MAVGPVQLLLVQQKVGADHQAGPLAQRVEQLVREQVPQPPPAVVVLEEGEVDLEGRHGVGVALHHAHAPALQLLGILEKEDIG